MDEPKLETPPIRPVRAHVFITGGVRGVFFREYCMKEARELRLTGWVRNNPDGKVEALFEGPDARVREILLWCKEGPKMAKVENVEVKYEPHTNEFKDFKKLD